MRNLTVRNAIPRRAALALAALAAVLIASPGAPQAAPRQEKTPPLPLDLSSGRLRLTVERGARFRLLVDGVPVVTHSHLYLVKPGWTGLYLNTDETTPKYTVTEENGQKVATAAFENADSYARYRFELRPASGASGSGGALTVRVAYGMKNGQPAEVEYAAAYLNANPVSGQPFQADTVEGPRAGTVPRAAAHEDQIRSRLTPFVRRVRFDSRLGPITVTSEGQGGADAGALNLFDARGGTQEWATRHPILWLGIGSPARPVAAGENVVSVTYAFGPAPRREAAKSVTAKSPTVATVADARVPFAGERPLIPRPKEITPGADTKPLRLGSQTRIVLPSAPAEEEKRAAEELRAELKEFWHLDVPVVTGGAAQTGDIRLGKGLSLPGNPAPAPAEGYNLLVNADGAILSGTDGRGVFYGVQTLKQLLSADARGVYARAITIRDWPSLAWRGVHWFGGPRSWPFHERMIDRIIAPLKYNAMVYEVDYTQWESQPKTWWPDRSTPKADVRRTVDFARAHLLEPIPLVNALGHMEWLFGNGQNLDIAADPTHPYAIDPENPRTYEVLLPLLDEALEMFRPKVLHIGHDEVALEGTFPKKGSTKTETELFLKNVNQLHSHLTKRGVRTMMWGDMMLHSSEGSGGAAYAATPAESAERRAGVPKDILIADWHYGGPEYPSTALFKREGFSSIAGTWYDPSNIRDFARVAARDGADGLLQTTWAGYAMSLELVRGDSFAQFVAYVTAAEHAWNGGANDRVTLGWSPDEAFLALWDRKPVDLTSKRGFTVDLSAVANSDVLGGGEPGTAPPPSANFPTGDVSLGGTRYRVGRGVLLAGGLNRSGAWPRAVTLPLGKRKASALRWLLGSNFRAPLGTTVGQVRVEYSDGQSVEAPLTYGREVLAFDDGRGSAAAVTAWAGAVAGQNIRLRQWTWENPRPGVPITRVTLTSEGTEAAPVLLGLTGVE